MKTVIMAGGLGKRARAITSDIPKPLIQISGKPILQWEVENLVLQGFDDLIITVSHLSEKIQSYFGDGSSFGCRIKYYKEDVPLGNAGALFKLWESGELAGDFLLLNADSMFDVEFHRLVEFHKEHRALATIFTHPNSHPYDSGLIITNDKGEVQSWLTKEDKRPEFYKNRVNAGLHVLSTDILEYSSIDLSTIGNIGSDGEIVTVDLDRQILKPLAGSGKLIAYDSPEYVKDMGTSERFKQVCKDFESGKVSRRNLKNKQKAIFLDRDGTINRYVGFLRSIDKFTFIQGVAEAIRLINDLGYLAVIITNQPVIARGELTVAQLNLIHNKMETLLGLRGAYINAIYYCPHHPDTGFDGEISTLKISCNCRKPKPGLLLQAANDFNICLEDSWMIGDSWRDVKTGINAGTKTILLTGDGTESDVRPTSIEKNKFGAVSMCDAVCENLLEAVKLIKDWR